MAVSTRQSRNGRPAWGVLVSTLLKKDPHTGGQVWGPIEHRLELNVSPINNRNVQQRKDNRLNRLSSEYSFKSLLL